MTGLPISLQSSIIARNPSVGVECPSSSMGFGSLSGGSEPTSEHKSAFGNLHCLRSSAVIVRNHCFRFLTYLFSIYFVKSFSSAVLCPLYRLFMSSSFCLRLLVRCFGKDSIRWLIIFVSWVEMMALPRHWRSGFSFSIGFNQVLLKSGGF